jgi:hypothetical protein
VNGKSRAENIGCPAAGSVVTMNSNRAAPHLLEIENWPITGLLPVIQACRNYIRTVVIFVLLAVADAHG